MEISLDTNLDGIIFGFDLSITGKFIIIGFLFWAITFKIKK